MPKEIIISKSLPSKLEVISDFITQLSESIKSLNFQEEDLHNIRLALEEALTNAIRHGNKLNPDLTVEINVSVDDSKLTIEIVDEGSGFIFDHVPDPTRPGNINKASGRGVYLIKSSMDAVEYFDQGRGIKMTKLIRSCPRNKTSK